MLITDNEYIVACDVDCTLVTPTDEENGHILLTNPYSLSQSWFKIHYPHVELIKQYKGRGMFIRVWSHGGVKWAETVVNHLGLDIYVDSVETKPIKLIDDLPAEKIFKNVIYLNENGEENKC